MNDETLSCRDTVLFRASVSICSSCGEDPYSDSNVEHLTYKWEEYIEAAENVLDSVCYFDIMPLSLELLEIFRLKDMEIECNE